MPHENTGKPGDKSSIAAAPKAAGRLKKMIENPIAVPLGILLLAAIAAAGILSIQQMDSTIYIEKSEISSQTVTVSPQSTGILEKVFVNEGDIVRKGQLIARVSGSNVTSKSDGIVVSANKAIGQTVGQADALASIMDPKELSIIGRLQEDKGLNQVKPGQIVKFTVDAFGQKEYSGAVDSVSEVPRQQDIVFSISDKRQEKEFNVKVLFNDKEYPELKDGMSAKMWIYK
ncbi:Barrel-sandwich domain of CusB or HlyD membrane-fusion [uncultured archaeon]|nr:Barrel-sandwich domain of CusB or HlyD membrane-fusion [uncultured archaeon]